MNPWLSTGLQTARLSLPVAACATAGVAAKIHTLEALSAHADCESGQAILSAKTSSLLGSWRKTAALSL